MKHLHLTLLLAFAALITACQTLPDTPPPSVTDPAALAVFKKAQNGDGNCLYLMSHVYRKGLYNFPKSKTRARNLLKKATEANPPSPEACYEYFLAYFHDKRTRVKAIDNLAVALRNSEPRALEFFYEAPREAWETDQEKTIKLIMLKRALRNGEVVPCPSCEGLGTEDYTATRFTGSHYEGNVRVNTYEEYTATRPCSYCRSTFRRTPYPGYVKK